ncbi:MULTISPECIES: hypothetical protein [unclassified Pseudomonas]|uniref:hypothetical protein n=1 Tax=unclassified Pseudomonas TaxID=196821 RepID=UPI0024496708|nr:MULTISPECIES: hypothetical protein [unclassified Pseudomonas]MDH0300520.1 hypothetical protein [Pseudomonas sp. GD04091]MDH1984329.1 hypothetical protein [Pseudomonas sp. GD03689]
MAARFLLRGMGACKVRRIKNDGQMSVKLNMTGCLHCEHRIGFIGRYAVFLADRAGHKSISVFVKIYDSMPANEEIRRREVMCPGAEFSVRTPHCPSAGGILAALHADFRGPRIRPSMDSNRFYS